MEINGNEWKLVEILFQLISMYFNVFQCISMYFNVFQCISTHFLLFRILFKKSFKVFYIGTYSGLDIRSRNGIGYQQRLKKIKIEKERIAKSSIEIISATGENLWLFTIECFTPFVADAIKSQRVIGSVNNKYICIN